MSPRARPTPLNQAVIAGWSLLPAAVLFSISAGQVLAAGLVFHWLLTAARSRAGRPQELLLPLLGFLGWVAVAAFLAEPTAPDLSGALGKWIFALTLPAAWAYASRAGSVRGPLAVLFAAGICVLPWGLRDFLASEGGRAGALSGSGPHLGSNLMMGFVVAFSLSLAGRGGGAAAWAFGGISALLLAGLGLSLNRSALLGAAAGAAVPCARRRPILLAAALGLLAAGLATFPVSKPALRLRSAFQYPLDETARERGWMWTAGCRMIRARPLLGFTTRRGFADAYSSSYRDAHSLEARPGHVHNSYIQTAILHGIPGLGLLLWWLAAIGRLALARSRVPARDWPVQDALVPLFVAVLVNAGFDFVLADGQHALMWYALTGLLLGASRR